MLDTIDRTIRRLIAAGVLAVFVIAFWACSDTNTTRVIGEVESVDTKDSSDGIDAGKTTLCLKDPRDDDRNKDGEDERDPIECYLGALDGYSPSVGDCIRLSVREHTSEENPGDLLRLNVKEETGC